MKTRSRRMTHWTFIRRSLVFHARAHMGVLLGAAIAATVLTGALLVGDSMRQTLLDRALARLGPVEFAVSTQDRLFLDDLGARIAPNRSRMPGDVSTALLLAGTVSRQDGASRLNRVNVLGVDPASWATLAHWLPPAGTTQNPRLPSMLDTELQSWKNREGAMVNETMANLLGVKAGDEIIVRLRKLSALAQDAVISPRDDTAVALRLTVGRILPSELLGDFSLVANQIPPANIFLPLDLLQERLGVGHRANLLVATTEGPSATARFAALQDALKQSWRLEDAQLSVAVVEPPPGSTGGETVPQVVELATSRIFLEPQVVQAAASAINSSGVLTYLANLIQAGDHATPYSMVAAAGSPLVPGEMKDNEILANEWLARDLMLKPGDSLSLAYYVVDSASRLVERTNSFTVRSIVPIRGVYADRTLLPEFPGLARAESTHDWDAGFPLVHTIRPEDEAYWKQYRGTPKAFITLAAGRQMWTNRFGNLTAIRFPVTASAGPRELRNTIERDLRANLNPADFGFSLQPVREQALKAASQSQDFGQLFLGFSFFLIMSALLLMALLFQFSLEQRATEIGTLLALGFTPRQVRRMFLLEGAGIAFFGGVLGALGGVGYANAMLWALVTHWRSAVGTSVLQFHVSGGTLLIGVFAGAAVAILTIWLALRKQARQPAAALLAENFSAVTDTERGPECPRSNRSDFVPGAEMNVRVSTLPFPRAGRTGRLALLCGGLSLAAAVGLIVWAVTTGTINAGAFFGAGALLLVGGLALVSAWLGLLARRTRVDRLTLVSLGIRGASRRRSRSLATVALLASGTFVIVSIGVFRLDSNQSASRPDSGTGGFALIGESTLPVLQDLNTRAGREALGLGNGDRASLRAVQFRVRQGEDASCLNLNRAQKPRLLGVRPELLTKRFTFTKAASGLALRDGWTLLKQSRAEGEVPAIGDANSIQWALGMKVGDTMDYMDERGREFKLRLVGAIANSILQGSLVIDEEEFTKRFPSESGYRYFLLDAGSNAVPAASAALSRALQDFGFELTPATQRLNAFNAVQNTYLGTFQILGGLGLLLGSAGLGVVVLRNVLERRGELALLVAVGFRRHMMRRLLLTEHGTLLALGLGLGLLSALIAVLPPVLTPSTEFPTGSLAVTLGGVVLNGLLWTWLAARYALRGDLLPALRNE